MTTKYKDAQWTQWSIEYIQWIDESCVNYQLITSSSVDSRDFVFHSMNLCVRSKKKKVQPTLKWNNSKKLHHITSLVHSSLDADWSILYHCSLWIDHDSTINTLYVYCIHTFFMFSLHHSKKKRQVNCLIQVKSQCTLLGRCNQTTGWRNTITPESLHFGCSNS